MIKKSLVVHKLEQKWQRELDDHECNVLMQGYSMGSENMQELVDWLYDYMLLKDNNLINLSDILLAIQEIDNKKTEKKWSYLHGGHQR